MDSQSWGNKLALLTWGGDMINTWEKVTWDELSFVYVNPQISWYEPEVHKRIIQLQHIAKHAIRICWPKESNYILTANAHIKSKKDKVFETLKAYREIGFKITS